MPKRKILNFQYLHHFVPHEKNNGKATFLKLKFLFFYLLFFLLFGGFIKYVSKTFPGVLGYASNINTIELYKSTNQERIKNGKKPLIINTKLNEAAEKKAKHMFENNYWAHTSPLGVEPWDFILNSNYDYAYAGENLAKNFDVSSDVVEAWLNSPSHRENLLSENYDEIGFAVVNGTLDGYETTLVVQMFGRPRQPLNLANASSQENDVLNNLSQNPAIQSVKSMTADDVNLNKAADNFLLGGVVLDIAYFSRFISFLFGGFITSLLGLDFWYSKKKYFLNLSGHALAHLMLFILVLILLSFSFSAGRIL